MGGISPLKVDNYPFIHFLNFFLFIKIDLIAKYFINITEGTAVWAKNESDMVEVKFQIYSFPLANLSVTFESCDDSFNWPNCSHSSDKVSNSFVIYKSTTKLLFVYI